MSDNLRPDSGSSDLLSMEVGIGDALQLQDASAPQHRFHVNLIGFVNQQSVLVSLPEDNMALLDNTLGKEFLVRGFSGRKTYEFNAQAVQFYSSPYPYLHLSFPEQVSFVTMRAALRIRPKLCCAIETKATSQEISGIIEDISTSGARVVCKEVFGQLGDEVMLSFRLPMDGKEQFVVIPAAIRNIGNENAMNAIEYGLQFLHTGGKARMVLQNFIYKTMASN